MESPSALRLIADDSLQNDNTVDTNDAAADRKRRRMQIKSFKDLFDANTPTEDLIAQLTVRTVLHKVRSVDKFYARRYHIDLNNMRLFYEPSIKAYLCREVPYIDLCDLSEVRKGWLSDRFNIIESRFRRKLHASIGPKDLPELTADNCFSLVFDSGAETEDLVAPNTEVRDLWVKGLSYLIATYKNQTRENEDEVWLRQQFREADRNSNGNLSFDEVYDLVNHMNISMNRKHAKALFNMTHKKKLNLREMKGDDNLNMDEFFKFYELINERPELDTIFKKYSVNNTCIMGPEELQYFLKTEQKMTNATIEDCEAYIKRYEPQATENPGYMSIKGFKNLFNSIDFDIFNRSHRIVCMDMSQPLSHYYIATSHNTYLMMGQLTGASSIEAYRLALERGCRCVELDVWDGDDGEPIIYHGYTLTTKILLRDVLKTIHRYAFKKSQFPLILSMENHCSVEQQVVMAKLFEDILGDYLCTKRLDDYDKHWPSPEQLVRKIIVKGKKLPTANKTKKLSLKTKLINDTIAERQTESEDNGDEEEEEETQVIDEILESASSDNEDSDDDDDGADEEVVKNGNDNESDDSDNDPVDEVDDELTKKRVNNGMIRNNTYAGKENKNNDQSLATKSGHKALAMSYSTPAPQMPDYMAISKKIKLAKEFSDLVVYCVAKKFTEFTKCFKNWKFWEMVSFVETKSLGFTKIKKLSEDYVRFNKNHLSRIYPKGIRTDSSNYDPIVHWNMGAQLVALNYQTCDRSMLFNDALFAMNGRCGYVLKSEYLRRGHQYGNTSVRSSVRNGPNGKLKKVVIQIISGQHIPKPGKGFEGEIIDPYVKLRVYGHSADKFVYKTQPVKNNGFNPIWDESCNFLLRLPEMAFIHFQVIDESKTGKNALLGQYMLTFAAIMEGYRVIRLVDEHNQPIISATLFVKIAYEDVADYWSPE
ncbi:1-phosphatidylinositol 4,5-bisphosphate phosphodiesterase delta-4-like [Oppia nitens]|uniref:1-phosphatidylinositol 4,5-bisphosphate phosphodiesterase delta-4-like n=1 Tax=Oppia nitens TaxID=1686743 RepID=UPI0023DB2A91|nr:1-phosphatidylinositol 4,5-bisphosphate phosphodiesterase delta-4-like [Oppia nitens]